MSENAVLLSPAEIDAELARLWQIEQRARASFLSYREAAARDRKRGLAYYADQHEANAAKAGEVAEAARTEAKPLEARYTGWLRYFLVTNVNGHVHRGMDCSTCFGSTAYAWLTELSDCDEETMVAEWGETACTVCFPNAPAMKGFGDGTSGRARKTAAEKAARAAEKAERDAKKAAKTLESHLVFKGLNGWKVTTVAGAKTELREVAEARTLVGTRHDSGNGYMADKAAASVEVERLARFALEAKGVTAEEIDTIIERAEKKVRKEWDL